MPWPWGEDEPLHERLAREGGLSRGFDEPHDTTPCWGEVGIHGVARPRRWDAVEVVEAPGLTGDAVHFVALPDRSLIVDEDVPDDALAPLADAVEKTLEPPYRAEAVRRGEVSWAVAARRIEVVELPGDVAGDTIELTQTHEGRTLVVDGGHAFGSIPALEQLANDRYSAYVLRAERLDGPLFEIQISPL